MENCIVVQNLCRQFKVPVRQDAGLVSSFKSLFHREHKIVEAVKDVSFTVKRGEIRGLIGPNGAGKSTTIKMLSGILYPSSGDINVLGYTPWRSREHYVHQIGVVLGQKSQLIWDLPALDTFALNKQIYKIPDSIYQENLNYFCTTLGIEDVIKRPVRQLSLGERMKCELASSLLHNPELIFLDEPTIGIDILAKDAIINFIKTINATRKVTFILTTHDIADIETLCEKVTIINHGTVVFDDYLLELKKYFENKRIIDLIFNQLVEPSCLKGFDVKKCSDYSAQLELHLEHTDLQTSLQTLFNTLPIKDLTINHIKVEEVIKALYQKKAEQ